MGLILGWYDPIRGGIFLDGINTKEYNLKWLQKFQIFFFNIFLTWNEFFIVVKEKISFFFFIRVAEQFIVFP